MQMERTLDIRTALKRGIAELRDAEVPSYTLAAELLLLHVLGRERAWLYAHPEETVFHLDAHRYVSLIARRAEGDPTQYLTGKQEFWGLEFEVTPDVLIPRPGNGARNRGCARPIGRPRETWRTQTNADW